MRHLEEDERGGQRIAEISSEATRINEKWNKSLRHATGYFGNTEVRDYQPSS